MSEETTHPLNGVKDEPIPQEEHCTENRTIGKHEQGGEHPVWFPWRPEVEEIEVVSVCTEFKNKVVLP